MGKSFQAMSTKFYGVEPNLVCMRLKRGMTLKQALTCQVGKYGRKRRHK